MSGPPCSLTALRSSHRMLKASRKQLCVCDSSSLHCNMGSSGSTEEAPAHTHSPYSSPTTKSVPQSDPVAPDATRKAVEETIEKQFGDKAAFTRTALASVPVFKGEFKDLDFPAEGKSLIRVWTSADIVCQIEWAKYEWRRLSEVFAGKRLAVFDDIQPGDIVQGALGDSYFLAAISALAERPERIKRLFITQEVQGNCCYRLSLFNLGIWTEYYIDDFVPVSILPDNSPRLAFSGPKDSKDTIELWTILLEKAWAKKYQSYYDVQSGYSSEVLTDLTGAPCETLLTSAAMAWEKVVAAETADFVMLAATGELQDLSVGLIPSQCYAVLAAKTVGSAKLLKLRNPWGRFEWKGDWADASPLWTSEARTAMGIDLSSDDGVFCMCLEDFQRHFESLTVCYVHDQFWNFNLPMDQTKEEEHSVVQLTVEKPTLLYFLVCQIDERRFGGIEGGYQYAPIRLLLSKKDRNSLKYIDGKSSIHSRDAWMRAELDPGTYLWYIEMGWRSDLTALFGVSVYCANPVSLQDVTSDYPDYLEKCFNEDFVTAHAPDTSFTLGSCAFLSYKLMGIKANGDLREGLYVDVFANKSSEGPVSVVVKHQPWTNMRLCKPYQNNVMGNFELDVSANSYQIVVKRPINLLSPHAYTTMFKPRPTPRPK